MRLPSVALPSIVLMAGMLLPAYSFADDTATVGSSGGSSFDQQCGGESLVIGFDVTRGKALDSAGAVCGIRDNGDWTGQIINKGRVGGGGGEGPFTIRCPPFQAVAALDIHTDKFGAIRHFQIVCFAIGGTQATFIDSGNNGGEDQGGGGANCPPGQFATGVFGGFGDLVLRMGLHCSFVNVRTPPTDNTTTTTNGPIRVLSEVTGYSATQGGQDVCYLYPGDTGEKLGAQGNNWVHMRGTSGGCRGKEFWVYNEGQLQL